MNQQKYLAMGVAAAIAVALFIKAFYAFGSNNNFWLMLLTGIAAGMMYLVLNIFRSTKKISAGHGHTAQKYIKP